MFPPRIPPTYLEHHWSSCSYNSRDDSNHGINKSIELVLFGCQTRVRTLCHGPGQSLSICVEGLGDMDSFGLVVYLVACMGNGTDSSRGSFMILMACQMHKGSGQQAIIG